MSNEPELEPMVIDADPRFRRAPDHKTVYSNVIRTGITPFDIRIVFAQIGDPISGGPTVQNEDLVTVVMAPEEGKALVMFLLQALKGYESRFGKIRDVNEIMAKLQSEAADRKAVKKKAATAPKIASPFKPKKG